MARFEQRLSKQEGKVKSAVTSLFEKQGKQLAAHVRGEAKAGGKDLGSAADWINEFIDTITPVLRRVIGEAADDSIADYTLGISFDVYDPRVTKFIEQQAQRFATEVNGTTWDDLKAALAEGNAAGESIADLADRIEQVMGDRIASGAETIARTETLPAYHWATQESWVQSGVVSKKQYLATLDNRTRDTHAAAHGQTVGLDEPFNVGGYETMYPGATGEPDEDINCRCSMIAILE